EVLVETAPRPAPLQQTKGGSKGYALSGDAMGQSPLPGSRGSAPGLPSTPHRIALHAARVGAGEELAVVFLAGGGDAAFRPFVAEFGLVAAGDHVLEDGLAPAAFEHE